MPLPPGIRARLAMVVLLGVLASTISLMTLTNLLRTSTSQRVDRARDAVTETVRQLAARPYDLIDPVPGNLVGMHGGVAQLAEDGSLIAAPSLTLGPGVEVGPGVHVGTTGPARLPAGSSHDVLPDTWKVPFARAAATLGPGATTLVDVPLAEDGGDSRLVLAEARLSGPAPASSGLPWVAWAGYRVRPIASVRVLNAVLVLLAAVIALLVLAALHLAGTMVRGAQSINGSLRALGFDLDAPVARPELRELADVADGIAHLAQQLQRARREEVRLGRELARQERLAALGRVVAGVAHEVRNPLASIKLRLDLAVVDGARAARAGQGEGSCLPPAAEQAIAHASSEIARLDRLVADLLVVAGGASGPKVEGSLGKLARARVEALAPWAHERGVAIVVSGDARARFEQDAVARAIDNLLRNAVEASPHGAEVSVSVKGHPDDSGRAEILVEDVGIGVRAERTSELFEPFFTTKADGSGLGLALSRSIAQSQGGDVVYVRQPGRTQFILSVGSPVSSGDVSSTAVPTSALEVSPVPTPAGAVTAP